MKKLNCPHCKALIPRWGLIVRIHSPLCPVCKVQLGFSVKSAERAGAITGVILGVGVSTVLMLSPEKIWTWRFWGMMLPFGYVVGGINILAIGGLVPYDQGSWARSNWDLLPNVSGIRRRFLSLVFAALPVCALMLICADSLPLPIWLFSALPFIVVVLAILGYLRFDRNVEYGL